MLCKALWNFYYKENLFAIMKYDGPTFPFPTQIHKIWNFILVFTTFLLVLASATEGSSG